MVGKKGQKKRFWSDEEKRSICAQASASGVSVAQVASRYAMNANLIFKWLKDPRFCPAAGETPSGLDGGCVFLPVEISPCVDADHDEHAKPVVGATQTAVNPVSPDINPFVAAQVSLAPVIVFRRHWLLRRE